MYVTLEDAIEFFDTISKAPQGLQGFAYPSEEEEEGRIIIDYRGTGSFGEDAFEETVLQTWDMGFWWNGSLEEWGLPEEEEFNTLSKENQEIAMDFIKSIFDEYLQGAYIESKTQHKKEKKKNLEVEME